MADPVGDEPAPSSSSITSSSSGTRLVVVVVGALLAWLGLTIEPAAFSNDGPQHLWPAFVSAQGQSAYVVNTPPTANGAHQLIWLLLKLGCTPVWALAVAVFSSSTAFVVGFVRLSLAVDARRWPVALLAVAVSQQLSLQAGVLPYVLASSSSLLLIAFAVQPSSRTPRGRLLTALWLLVTAWLHIVAAAIAGIVVVVVSLVAEDRAGRARSTLHAVLTGVPAALVVVIVALMPTGTVGVDSAVLAFGVDALFGSVLPQLPVVDVVVVVVAMGAGLFTLWSRPRDARSLALAIAGLGLVLLACCLAPEAFGWQLMRERVFAAGIVLLLPLLPLERATRGVVALAVVAAIAASVAVVVQTRADDTRVARVLEPVVASMTTLPPQAGRWAAIVTKLPGDAPAIERARLAPWLHLGQVVATSVGGRPTFSQDDTHGIHHLLDPVGHVGGLTQAPSPVRWPQLWRAHDEARRRLVTAYAAWAATVAGTVVYGPADEVALFVAQGHAITATTATDVDGNVAFLARFVGCAADVVFDSAAAADDVVEVGFFPAIEPLSSFPLARGRRVVHLHEVPCGQGVWWRRRSTRCGVADGRLPLPAIAGQARVDVSCPP